MISELKFKKGEEQKFLLFVKINFLYDYLFNNSRIFKNEY